jgi:hypothetical protein
MTEAATPIDLIDPVPEAKPRRKRTNGNELAVQSAAPAPATAPVPSLPAILQGVMSDPNASIERLNAAFDFYQRMEAAAARKAFETAMADAKAEFEPIVKRHLVGFENKGGGSTSYKHEDLADIEAAVKPALAGHGLSYRFRGTSKPNEPVSVTCIITHRDGHFEETTLSAGADGSGGKNSIQGIGSTITYLQRYTLKLALGLAAGRDDDGHAAGETKPIERITEQQAKELEALATKANTDLQVIYEHFKVAVLSDLTPAQFKTATNKLNTKLKLEGAA